MPETDLLNQAAVAHFMLLMKRIPEAILAHHVKEKTCSLKKMS
jgi:hypothetical protein